ncbi:hypothetical protein F4813DRAFT_395003 [Daldinia decipiens]|uniref:uncharacterized protein n=1 Tax=Daldinia decipiens TaxID=326647 RepID=UPI0020C209CA|nr:uncharacterized protein F4813DRAFT_395003 [Daldinia decipiens]KAI1662952.1 hypothetical protein F4813DRAFT_395003 [Daldinia decipiens]
MYIIASLINICWFASVTRAVSRYMPPADGQRAMELFTTDRGYSGTSDGKTWHASYKEEGFDEMNMEILHRIASAHFNWLLAQQGQYRITNQLGGCLISALWTPDTNSVYVSTKARGPYWGAMLNNKETAPVWRARTENWKKNGKRDFHVEDATYHWFEEVRKSAGDPIWPLLRSSTAAETKYPEGSMIATWGFHGQEAQDNPAIKNTGRPISLCSIRDQRGVTCQQMADDLGVKYEAVTNQPPAEQAIDSSPPDGDEISNDPCGSNAAKRDNSGFLPRYRKRDAASECSISENIPTSLVISTVTGLPSPASSYDKGPSTSSRPMTTPPPPPKPSCVMQDMDPGLGITAPGCICEGSTTLPLLTLPSVSVYTQSCDYTALPTKTLPNPISITTQTWTVGCQACTGVGGAEVPAAATCTSVPSCTVTPLAQSFGVLLSNTSVPVGDADDKNGGKDLRQNLYSQLHPLCPDNSNICDYTKGAEIKNMGTVVSDGDAYLTLQAKIIGSQYNSTDTRERLLAAAVASWERAASQSCKEVEYKSDADPTESGCGSGPILDGRSPFLSEDEGKSLDRRILDGPPPETVCSYRGRLCAGPEVVTAIMGTSENPYMNHMQIKFELVSDNKDSAFAEFVCHLVIDAISDLSMAVMPELAPAELFEQLELESLCE